MPESKEQGDAVRNPRGDVVYAPKEQKPEEPSLLIRWYEELQKKWDNRPTILEVHYLYLPLALMAGALAIGTVDETLHTHIAERMARVQVDKKDNILERSVEKAIHELGVQAVKAEK